MPLTDCKFVWKNGAIVHWADATVHDAVTGRQVKHCEWLTYVSWIEDADTKANGSPGMKRLD